MKENYITISTLKKMSIENNEDEQRMTSLEIAELTGKQHKHVMEAIRKMEAGWAQVAGSNFRLGSYKDANGQLRPCYNLSKTETLYIATKFNDEARARLVLRWKELEEDQQEALQWERWKARYSQIERPQRQQLPHLQALQPQWRPARCQCRPSRPRGPRPPARADEMTQDANTFLFIWHFQDYSLTLTFGLRSTSTIVSEFRDTIFWKKQMKIHKRYE